MSGGLVMRIVRETRHPADAPSGLAELAHLPQ